MRTVWKFPLRITTVIEVPFDARVLMVALCPDTEEPAMWVELDPEAPRIRRTFVVHGTGQSIEGDGGFPSDIHVGSVIDEPFVWHVYERRQG